MIAAEITKADEVIFALQGVALPLDAAGRLVKEGDWVIRAMMIGQSATLLWGRAFPFQKDKRFVTTVYGVSTDESAYVQRNRRNMHVRRGTVQLAYRMLIVNEDQIPTDVRHVLGGTKEELDVRYKSRAQGTT